jgi:tetratricopeptide (TPR) repeat protein
MKGDDPKEAAYWSSMVDEARIRIARSQSKLGDKAGARATLDKALEQQSPLVKQQPYNVLHSFYLAHIELELGKIDQAEEKWFEGKEHFDQAWDIAERIWAGDIRHKEYALLRIEALAGLEKTRHEIGDLNGEKEAKARRCEIIKDFARRDPEDRRFDGRACN